MGIKFSNVPTNRTKEVVPKMIETIQKLVDDGPEKFDIEHFLKPDGSLHKSNDDLLPFGAGE